MIALLVSGLVLPLSSQAYYAILAYVSAAIAFFLVRTLKLRIEPEVRLSRRYKQRCVNSMCTSVYVLPTYLPHDVMSYLKT